MNKEVSPRHFFSLGGTLHSDSPSYVKRSADDELLELALAGEFCYVLTARQMGKSSLMIRTADRLKAQGIKTAILDLPRFGFQSITVDQWYLGLLNQLQEHLRFTEDPMAWWDTHAYLGHVPRFIHFLRHIILSQITGQMVIFIDEIDLTLKLAFRDEFFAAIRAMYNARATDPEFKRVTFVFLGVAAPTDLIEDRVRTPFNIALPIILQDISLNDAYILQEQLETVFPSQGKLIFEHIYRWTSGHPYLTQKLCLTVVQNSKRHWDDERIIDGEVKELFQKNRSDKDDNLKWVENFILTHQEQNDLLKLYKKVCQGQKVPDERQSIIHNQLKLSGLVKVKDGHLHLRNNIYKLVFDLDWVKQNSKITQKQTAPPLVTGSLSLSEALRVLVNRLNKNWALTGASLTILVILLAAFFLPGRTPIPPNTPIASSVAEVLPIVTKSETSTSTSTPTAPPTQTATPALTATQTATPALTATQTATPALTATQTAIPALTATQTATPALTATQTTVLITETPTQTAIPTPPPIQTTEQRESVSPTTPPPTVSPPTETPLPPIVTLPTNTPASTETLVSTETPVSTETLVSTETPVSTETLVSTETPVPTDTSLPTGTPVPTDTPLPTGTPVLTDTPLPAETPVPTDTSLPTGTPVPTQTPPPINTPESTDTPSPAVVPTATPEPTETGTTSTQRVTYVPPQLLAPQNGESISQPILLQWSWAGTLQENEYFDVRVWGEGNPPWGIAWTKGTSYLFDPSEYGGGNYFWTIAVIDGQDSKMEEEFSVAEPLRSLNIDNGNNPGNVVGTTSTPKPPETTSTPKP